MKHPDYVISSSYGNDSVAMIQWAFENDIQELFGNVCVVYCDTGWCAKEWPARVDACEAFAKRCGFETHRVVSMGMPALIRIKKGWPGNGQQFCTAHLKGVPFLEWLDPIDAECRSVVMIGKRREESAARKDTPEWIMESEYHGGRTIWHPLFLHKEEERNALLKRAGFEPLPHRSRECHPCVNANKGDIRSLTTVELTKVNDLEVEIGKPMFRPKRFNSIGIYGVRMWAEFGKHHTADIPEDEGCGAPFGCGL